MVRNLIKIISIILLLTAPASCEVIKPIVIEDAVNIGAVDITLTYNGSLFVITDVADGDFDVTGSNLERNHTGTVHIAAFQTDNPGLNGRVTIASVTLDGDLDDLSSLSMAVNTLTDATPRCNPIESAVDGFTIKASPASTSTSTGSGHGGGGIEYTSVPSPTPAAPSAAPAPVEQEPPARATPTPTHLTAFHTEPSSLPSPILSPIAGIVIVVIAAIIGIVRVISITAQTRDETHAETVTPTEQTEQRKAIAAITGIIVVAIMAIIGILLM